MVTVHGLTTPCFYAGCLGFSSQKRYGKTTTYKEIAQRIAADRGIPRMAPQAVGGAVGGNPIFLIIPCHRVIGTDGSLTGYGGGLWRKEALLKMESAARTENPELRELQRRVGEHLVSYNGGEHIFTDDQAPVELMGMNAMDVMIRDEIGYYKELYREKGLRGLLGEM